MPSGRCRLLIVDDSETVLSLLRLLFEGDDYEVETAGDGLEAIESIRRQPPDLVITDSVMPRLDGLELLRQIRREPGTRHIPLILLTGSEAIGDLPNKGWMPDAVAAKSGDWQNLLDLAKNLLHARASQAL
jgi:CheY-like chemotaxis protein